MSNFETLLLTQTEKQLSILQDQSLYYHEWLKLERKLIDKVIGQETFGGGEISDQWETAAFQVIEGLSEIKGKWNSLIGLSLEEGLYLANRILRCKESITLRSLAIEIKLEAKLAVNSELWIITRGSGVKDPNSAIIRISKESEIDGIFIVFGSPIGNDEEFIFFKRQQIPEEVISENIGLLIAGCHGQFRNENIVLIRKTMGKDFSGKKSIAFNYPGIVKLLSLCNELRDIAVTLSNDSDVRVRVVLASGFHEVLRLNRHCKILKKVALKLIEDNETRIVIFRKLNDWSGLIDSSQLLIKYIKLLTQPIDWRTLLVLLKNFSESFENFSLKEVLDHLVPLLLHKMLTSCWPVKVICSETLANIIRNTFYLTRKYDICNITKEPYNKNSY